MMGEHQSDATPRTQRAPRNRWMRVMTMAMAVVIFAPVPGQGTALAERYQRIAPEDSSVAFTYRQMGVSLRGSFAHFDGTLVFDPARPEEANAQIDVRLESISTGLAEADTEVVKPTWFNIPVFPVARFESRAVRVLDAPGHFEITGDLSIKGHTREVVFPARFNAADGVGRFEGDLRIRRGDFSVGEGSWSRFNILANEVTVHFSMAVLAE
jgi:polyisoprenoid-binding protein YceI